MYSQLKTMILFRTVCYLCAFYFFFMGLSLILFPEFISRIAGPQDPIILGMLRGAGGSIIPYALLYIFVASSAHNKRWAVIVIAVANFVAIILDFLSVYLGEYLMSYAMIDVPIEVLSLLVMVLFLVRSPYEQPKVIDE